MVLQRNGFQRQEDWKAKVLQCQSDRLQDRRL